jgi:glucosamine-6-phosphate deaminase
MQRERRLFMRIVKTKNYHEMSKQGASILAAEVMLKPNCVLGLATGSTPIGTYEQLIERYNRGEVDFSQIATVNLDEYKGLEKEDDQSYYYFMNNHLFDGINVDQKRTYLPDGMALDSEKECERFENLIEELGGVDIQVLGIGHNGHIGFNEPSSVFEKVTHCVDLAEETIEANKRFFDSADDVPGQAYTMGIGTIMKAKKILLLVYGVEKAGILAKALLGDITPEVPASILQLHPDVILVGDEEALSGFPG